MITALIICSVFAVNFNISASDTVTWKTSKAGSLKPERPGNSSMTMKKIALYILLYIPNRIVDATDMFSFNVNAGDGFWLEMQATRFAQMGGSNSKSYFMTKGYSRQFGCGHKDTKRFSLGFLENDLTVVSETTGNVEDYVIYFPYLAVANRHLYPFRDGDVDFWKIGGNMGWFIGGGFGFHPIEVADFFTGIIGIDISRDDF